MLEYFQVVVDEAIFLFDLLTAVVTDNVIDFAGVGTLQFAIMIIQSDVLIGVVFDHLSIFEIGFC